GGRTAGSRTGRTSPSPERVQSCTRAGPLPTAGAAFAAGGAAAADGAAFAVVAAGAAEGDGGASTRSAASSTSFRTVPGSIGVTGSKFSAGMEGDASRQSRAGSHGGQPRARAGGIRLPGAGAAWYAYWQRFGNPEKA